MADHIKTCTCCGLVQMVPEVPSGMVARCPRCNTSVHRRSVVLRSAGRTAAVAMAALILYPFAVTLPIMRVERFGHHTDSSIVSGTINLLKSGDLFVGLVVLLCSIILPVGKLAAMLLLSLGGARLRGEHRALTYHIVEFTGRWGMLDVLLVTILVAALKMGDFMEVTAGPGVWAFCVVVLLSLIATACFDPHTMWWEEEGEGGDWEGQEGEERGSS